MAATGPAARGSPQPGSAAPRPGRSCCRHRGAGYRHRPSGYRPGGAGYHPPQEGHRPDQEGHRPDHDGHEALPKNYAASRHCWAAAIVLGQRDFYPSACNYGATHHLGERGASRHCRGGHAHVGRRRAREERRRPAALGVVAMTWPRSSPLDAAARIVAVRLRNWRAIASHWSSSRRAFADRRARPSIGATMSSGPTAPHAPSKLPSGAIRLRYAPTTGSFIVTEIECRI